LQGGTIISERSRTHITVHSTGRTSAYRLHSKTSANRSSVSSCDGIAVNRGKSFCQVHE